MKTSTLLTALMALVSLCISCTKTGYDELKGQWIEEDFDKTVYENGKKKHYLSYYEYDFKEDCVNKSFIIKIDGELVLEVICEGNWDYIKGPFKSGSRNKGMIEIIYDLDTFTVEYDQLNDPSLIEKIRESLIANNESVERVKKEDSDSYYGYSIIEINQNYIEFESNNSEFLFWTRADAYEKYGVGGGDLCIVREDDEEGTSEPQSLLPPKKEFLDEAGTEYYDCVFTDDNHDAGFYLSLNPEIGTGIYQAPSGNIYYLKIENENDNRTEFHCSATTIDGNSSKIQFNIDLNNFNNIQGTMLGTDGETLMSFVGNLIENE